MIDTASGILLHIFHRWDLLELDLVSPATEEHQAYLKEDLMHILGDSEGTQLSAWRRLWTSDRGTFEDRALHRIHVYSERHIPAAIKARFGKDGAAAYRFLHSTHIRGDSSRVLSIFACPLM